MLGLGIVGLPNVGKSTLFNAITKAQVEAANYPFATIEKNVGVVAVPDKRLEPLQELYSKGDRMPKIIPTTVEFVDIAGLVKGASRGEGLGNKFLANIREVSAIAHVVRCFKDDNIVHVSAKINPIDDIEVINTELALADITTLENRLEKLRRSVKGDKSAQTVIDAAEKMLTELENGKMARQTDIELPTDYNLLTAKPVIYVCNVAEEDAATGNADVEKIRELAQKEGSEIVLISAQIEQEIAEFSDEEATEYLAELGLKEPGLHRLIKKGYEALGLISYLTAGEKETRAWTIKKGSKAPQAAGVIHTDFERGFIRAEVIAWDKLLEAKSMVFAKGKGWVRTEGKEYVVQDGDVINFLFNV